MRKRRHRQHAPAVTFDMTAEIGQRAAQSNVVIDQNIRVVCGDVALERGRSHQSVEGERSCVPYPIVLNDLAEAHRQAELGAEDLGHGIRDRVETGRLKCGNWQEYCRAPGQQLTKRRGGRSGQQVFHEDECGMFITALGGRVGWVVVPEDDLCMHDDLGKRRGPRRTRRQRRKGREFVRRIALRHAPHPFRK